MEWQAPKGTRDFYPQETAVRDYIFDSWRKSCQNYGFEPYDAPVFEHLEVYTQKSGDEIEGQLYTFEDKGGRKLALRPEMTPSLARMVAAKSRELKKPIKWYSVPKLFRYEKMQKGRLREFFQLNMDILGIEDAAADAELIAAAIDMLRDLGLSSEDFQVHVSSRTLLEELFLFVGVAREDLLKLYAILDKMNKVSPENFALMIDEFFANEKEIAQKVKNILNAKNLDEILAINSENERVLEINTLFGYLRNLGLGDFVRFDISVVRGLAYYTGIVFEIFDKKRAMRAIAGGGRYDKLVELYGGLPTPAVGFAVGDVVLGDLLRELGKLPEIGRECDIFIVSFDKNYENLLKTAKIFREAGFSVQYPLKPGNFGKQMAAANEAGAKYVLFVGSQEETEGNYKIKIMATGEEKIITKETAAEEIRLI